MQGGGAPLPAPAPAPAQPQAVAPPPILAHPPPQPPPQFFTHRWWLVGVTDVENFPWEMSEGEESMSLQLRRQLYDFVQRGIVAFRENRFDEALNWFAKANHIRPDDPIILSNRCIAYMRLGEYLKSRPPSVSDSRPLSGLDPTTHAGLALKDAEKVMSLRTHSVKSYILKANALVLLEKYDLAREVAILGLQIDPSSNPLHILARSTAGMTGRRNLGRSLRTDDFDCTVCLKLLYEPVTTPCGHSFCRSCLFQSMDRSNKCPLCRTILFVTPRTCSISVTLKSIIMKNFPQEYADRMNEHRDLINLGVDLLPLFVMDVAVPCQKIQLNIFEPRYRLMVRRAMEGNRRMGMVVIDIETGTVADHGCEVEIIDCEPLSDGRFFLEVVGRRRCRIIRHWDQDGYRVAEVEWTQDVHPPEGTVDRNDLQKIVTGAASYARRWMRAAKVAAEADEMRSAELGKIEGLMPTTQDPEHFSFWLATLTKRRPAETLDLLRIRDTRERIQRALIYMRADVHRYQLRLM